MVCARLPYWLSCCITFPPDWLDLHPLTARELAHETEVLGKLGLKLVIG